jgi:hypothetical protein
MKMQNMENRIILSAARIASRNIAVQIAIGCLCISAAILVLSYRVKELTETCRVTEVRR